MEAIKQELLDIARFPRPRIRNLFFTWEKQVILVIIIEGAVCLNRASTVLTGSRRRKAPVYLQDAGKASLSSMQGIRKLTLLNQTPRSRGVLQLTRDVSSWCGCTIF